MIRDVVNFISYDMERPNFKNVNAELSALRSELNKKGEHDLAQQILRIQNMIDDEIRKNDDFRTILSALANVTGLKS